MTSIKKTTVEISNTHIIGNAIKFSRILVKIPVSDLQKNLHGAIST